MFLLVKVNTVMDKHGQIYSNLLLSFSNKVLPTNVRSKVDFLTIVRLLHRNSDRTQRRRDDLS